MTQKIFLSFDFEHGNIVQWFKDSVRRVAGSQVEVVVADHRKPQLTQDIVRNMMADCDVVFCFLTKQSEGNGRSVPSPWVLTEATYARAMGKRVIAFREPEIDWNSLALAFEDGMMIPDFIPGNLLEYSDELDKYLRGVITPLFKDETLYAQKKVYVKRNGSVENVLYYKRLIFSPDHDGKIGHCIWRVYDLLPELEIFQIGKGQFVEKPYLDAYLIVQGAETTRKRIDITNLKIAADGKQLLFDLIFPKDAIRPYHAIQYEFIWGYQNAFWNKETLEAFAPNFSYNSAGLRSGNVGEVAISRLELHFERMVTGETFFESDPVFSIAQRFPRPDEKMFDFWVGADGWSCNGEPVHESADLSSHREAVYVFQYERLNTTVRAKWKPVSTYHTRTGGIATSDPVKGQVIDQLTDIGSILRDEESSPDSKKHAVEYLCSIFSSPSDHGTKELLIAAEIAANNSYHFNNRKSIVRDILDYAFSSWEIGLLPLLLEMVEAIEAKSCYNLVVKIKDKAESEGISKVLLPANSAIEKFASL